MNARSCIGLFIALALTAPRWVTAQVTDFSDNFSSSSINGNDATTPPTSTSTSYDIDSTKTGNETMTSGNFDLTLTSATTAGFVEAEALFTTSPVTLSSTGDYIDMTYTFTDTANVLGGTSSSAIFSGLYNSGGAAPVAGSSGSGNAVGLTGTGNSTGNAAGWQGYVGRLNPSGGTSEAYNRAAQTATGNSAQDLLGSSSFTGGFQNPAGSTLSGTQASTLSLTPGSQYTVDYRITLSGPGQLTVNDTIYSGTLASGSPLGETTSTTSGTQDLTSTFDGLALGIYNKSSSSLNPSMDINDILITSETTAVPEPGTFGLFASGFALVGVAWRRSQSRR